MCYDNLNSCRVNPSDGARLCRECLCYLLPYSANQSPPVSGNVYNSRYCLLYGSSYSHHCNDFYSSLSSVQVLLKGGRHWLPVTRLTKENVSNWEGVKLSDECPEAFSSINFGSNNINIGYGTGVLGSKQIRESCRFQ